MNRQHETAKQQLLPPVDEHVIAVLRASQVFDPTADRENFRTTVEEDQQFAHQILIEGNRRSNGDIKVQEAFIEGAAFAREALRRTAAIQNLATSPVTTDKSETELIVQPELEKTRRRFGFGSLSAMIAVFSIFRHSSSRPHSA